jgi:DNA repair exonuclease SbcCD ATPase subunit
MHIERIELCNFRNFSNVHEFQLEKINLISGQIGVGKSTLGRIAITFALYGDSEVTLSSLVNRSAKASWVALIIEDKNDVIYIKRSIPSKLEISLNDVNVLEGSTNTEKEAWIKNRFGDLNHFKKFRMIDLRQGVNLLEEGKTALRKTLLSMHEDMFNHVRTKLLDKKNTIERFNLDSVVVYKHFPSVKRLEVLNASLKELMQAQADYDNEVKANERTKYQAVSKLGEIRNKGRECSSKLQHLQTNSFCPTCKQQIIVDKRDAMIAELQKQVESLNKEMIVFANKEKELSAKTQELRDTYRDQDNYRQHIQELIFKLTTRLKQKDYKYTNKDVLVVSNAIKELDKFFSYYIVACVKNLEPIINEVIEKIGFEVYFNTDKKGDFTLSIMKSGQEYDYKELSSGQRLLITIAFQIALLLDNGETGVIIADEGFSNFDEITMRLVYDLFNDLPFQLISIVHRFDNPDEFINIINLNKYFGDK